MSDTNAAAGSAAVEVDLNNLNLSDEEPIEGLDLDADPNAALAPKCQDGVHQVRLTLSERKPKLMAKAGKDGKTSYYFFVAAKVTEPGTPSDDGFADDILSSRVQSNGACGMARFLVAAGLAKESVARMGQGLMAKTAYELVQGEPSAEVETQWQTRDEENNTFLRGQKRYPKNGTQYTVPDVNPKNGSKAYTRAQIVGYKRVG